MSEDEMHKVDDLDAPIILSSIYHVNQLQKQVREMTNAIRSQEKEIADVDKSLSAHAGRLASIMGLEESIAWQFFVEQNTVYLVPTRD